MSYKAFAAIKERMEIEAITRMTPEHINDLINEQHARIKELEYELGQPRIQLDHKTMLPVTCSLPQLRTKG